MLEAACQVTLSCGTYPMSKQGRHPVLSPLWQKQWWVTPTLHLGGGQVAAVTAEGFG